jgi:hypothetical protein
MPRFGQSMASFAANVDRSWVRPWAWTCSDDDRCLDPMRHAEPGEEPRQGDAADLDYRLEGGIASRRNDYEDACLHRLTETLPPGFSVTILANRGFGDQKLFAYLQTLGFGYVIRLHGNIQVADVTG